MQSARRRLSVLAVATACSLTTLACGDDGGGGVEIDAATDGDAQPRSDAGSGRDGAAPLSWVDFAVTGCARFEAPSEPMSDGGIEPARCFGDAPLQLGFAAVAPSLPSQYLWTFGDGSQSAAPAPTHVFDLPGTYDVALVVGGPGGTASQDKPGFIIVESVSGGGACTSDAQCATSDCACGAPCPGPLATGVCSADCESAPCSFGACFDLRPTQPASAAAWHRQLCLTPCIANSDCGGALVCDQVKDDEGALTGACVFPGLAPIGASCADGSGALDGARCAAGECSDRGAHGLCAPSCSAGGCPDGTACAIFGAGDSRCVAACTTATSCTLDPLLACELPGATGANGFTIDQPAASLGYCAPRACTDAAECPGGACTDGHCVR